jgi:RNA polymerase sigma-70 factor (ECF subfamily)
LISYEPGIMQEHPDSGNFSDEESVRLARAYLAGDRRAFDELIKLHQRQVFNLCFRLLGDYDEADDCAQQVFIKVSRSLKGFRFESAFGTWLYRIAVNTCKNRLTSLDYRLKARKIRIDLERDMDHQSPPADLEDPAPAPDHRLIGSELSRLIQRAIGALPARQRLVVVLRDIEGRSYEEIGEITGLKLGTVKSKLSRAREQLRESLKGKI